MRRPNPVVSSPSDGPIPSDGGGPGELAAPALLREEMGALLRFKSATLTDIGYQHSGVWEPETASQREEHLVLLFGALAASPDDEVAGLGMAAAELTFGLLVVPSVWDWYWSTRSGASGASQPDMTSFHPPSWALSPSSASCCGSNS
ncbi:hypothetical protein D3C87_618520 [compost metagenome]